MTHRHARILGPSGEAFGRQLPPQLSPQSSQPRAAGHAVQPADSGALAFGGEEGRVTSLSPQRGMSIDVDNLVDITGRLMLPSRPNTATKMTNLG